MVRADHFTSSSKNLYKQALEVSFCTAATAFSRELYAKAGSGWSGTQMVPLLWIYQAISLANFPSMRQLVPLSALYLTNVGTIW